MASLSFLKVSAGSSPPEWSYPIAVASSSWAVRAFRCRKFSIYDTSFRNASPNSGGRFILQVAAFGLAVNDVDYIVEYKVCHLRSPPA